MVRALAVVPPRTLCSPSPALQGASIPVPRSVRGDHLFPPPGKDRPRRIGVASLSRSARFLVVVLLLATGTGCGIVPRSRMDECQRLTQTLRSENARLKDRVLALRAQNRDYAERAVDDGRRLAIQDEAIERLEHSVQAYQDERAPLEAAYHQLTSRLGAADSLGGARPGPADSDNGTGER
jgi:hypothetical protein